jgi:hypothetical protein
LGNSPILALRSLRALSTD